MSRITTTKRKFALQLVALVLACELSLVAAPLSYTAIALGTLGGTETNGYGINASGQVTSSSRIAGDAASHAFVYGGGSMTDLGTLGGTYGEGRGINDSGQVAGWATLAGGDFAPHAFLYSGGSLVDLGTLGGRNSRGYAINNNGQVTGESQFSTGNGDSHAFLYSGGLMTDLGTLGGSRSHGRGINGSGQGTGYSDDVNEYFEAFLYSNGSMMSLGTLDDPTSTLRNESFGSAINASGQVTGHSTVRGWIFGDYHAFRYSNGRMTDLGTLGGMRSYGLGINASGQVTGYSETTENDVNHAFLYSSGTMYDLNSLVSRGLRPGVYLEDAPGINDRGWIVANGSDGMAYLLQPTTAVPEPGSLALCGMGTCLLIVLRLRASNANKLQ